MKKLTYKNTFRACYLAYITQAIVVNFMPVLFVVFQDQYQISFSDLGLLVLLNFVTQIIVDIIAAKNVDKIGFRHSAVPAHLLCAIGLICMGILPPLLPNPYIGLVISVIIFAFGGGLIEVVVSPVVDLLPSDDSSSSMSFLHSFYCWGQLGVVLLTTLVLKIFGYGSWGIISICWAIIPIINAYNFSRVPLPKTLTGERHPMRELLKTKGFLIALLLMMGAGAAEQTMAQWASLFAQKGLDVSKVMGDLLGPCMFALFMAIGRIWYGIKGAKVNLKNALFICSILCIICYFISVFSRSSLISLIACAFTGFSVSLMWPGVLSYTSGCFPKGGAAMFGVMAIFGDVGCSIGPWISGVVSDATQNLPQVVQFGEKYGLGVQQVGLKAGMLMGIIFPIIMMFGLAMLKKEKEN